MTTHKKITPEEAENAMNAAQVEFTANPRFLAPQLKHVLQAQEYVLDEFEKFSSAWFQRREDATRSMIDAGRRVISEGQSDPARAMKELVDWQTKSMEHLTEDAKAFTEMMTQCAGAVVTNEIEAAEETVEYTQKATKPSTSMPV